MVINATLLSIVAGATLWQLSSFWWRFHHHNNESLSISLPPLPLPATTVSSSFCFFSLENHSHCSQQNRKCWFQKRNWILFTCVCVQPGSGHAIGPRLNYSLFHRSNSDDDDVLALLILDSHILLFLIILCYLFFIFFLFLFGHHFAWVRIFIIRRAQRDCLAPRFSYCDDLSFGYGYFDFGWNS